MFGVGSGELLLVFVIGLIVLGPERLPKVAAQVGRWVARARRMANQLRYQLEQEIALEELRAKNLEASKAEAARTEAKSLNVSEQSAAEGDGTSPRVESVASAEAENDAVPAGHDAAGAGDEEADTAPEIDAPAVPPLPAPNVRPLGSAFHGTAPPGELRQLEVGDDEAEVLTPERADSVKAGSAE
jgi:sec-independent protein translocase protein TatB